MAMKGFSTSPEASRARQSDASALQGSPSDHAFLCKRSPGPRARDRLLPRARISPLIYLGYRGKTQISFKERN